MEKKSFAKNAFACILAGMVISASFTRITNRFFQIMPMVVAIGLAVFLVLSSVIFSIIWYRKDKEGTIDSTRMLALFQGLLRYAIAFDLCMIAWQKIFHLQFMTPIGKLDNPFSSFSLSDLMWAFFGQSYPFIVTIGLSQIIGSVLLLFGRTRLIGVFILIPVLLNIIFIDFFYEIGVGPLFQAIILLAGVTYFLFIEYDRLKVFFLLSNNDLPSIRINSNLMKNVLRFSVVIIPLLLILTNTRLAPYVYQKTQLPKGRYEVRKLSINQKDIQRDGCDSVLTMVYLHHDIVFQSGDIQKRLFGKYTYNENTKEMKAIWHYPKDRKDTLTATVTKTENTLILDGKMGAEWLRMELVKIDPPKYP